jgi:hypothetical protein
MPHGFEQVLIAALPHARAPKPALGGGVRPHLRAVLNARRRTRELPGNPGVGGGLAVVCRAESWAFAAASSLAPKRRPEVRDLKIAECAQVRDHATRTDTLLAAEASRQLCIAPLRAADLRAEEAEASVVRLHLCELRQDVLAHLHTFDIPLSNPARAKQGTPDREECFVTLCGVKLALSGPHGSRRLLADWTGRGTRGCKRSSGEAGVAG